MKTDKTTMKISKQTKDRLDYLKEYDRETYEEVIIKIIHILNTFRKKPEAANRILRNIDINIKRKQEYTGQNKIKKKQVKLKQVSSLQQNPQQEKGSH